ncbi:RHS repeat-associated core domain-containing protein [Aquimarina sp. BL5]|uniref:DUF6443 domain-containing protein n=1 Tax=Aquimarina sp. BL5 TaxID=1714860 RepID=UPI000E4F21AA|nr:DUF6443 domain-containing protein [Aquimarina sp. BL5]AXT52774.1 RHS repeat-associated core domain-containing protein [Aquimarina sp. BL5]RKN03746.1 RHS repeat-associated core domain-containing protein [Aquimarina sp. BL5]
MKNIVTQIATVLLVLVSVVVTAQTADTVIIENETINASSDPALLNISAGQKIIIKPTTWIQPGTVFSATISGDPYVNPLLSTDENYVFTRVYQKEKTSFSEVSNNSDVIESITYFDGLGRATQQIGIKASPDKKDIVTHMEYDTYGRQAKQYLPFERQNEVIGSYDPVDVITDINSYYKTKYPNDFIGMAEADVNAYSETIFEKSPLSRPLKQAAPGLDWIAKTTGDDHTIKLDRRANNAADDVVYFRVNFIDGNTEAPSLVKVGDYPDNELFVNITKDENWVTGDGDNHTTQEFTDKSGRVILKRTFNSSPSGGGAAGGGGAHDTYYVYDDFGNLTYVIPPKVIVSDGISSSELNELCYQYIYDYRNRLIEKKIPGKGWEYIVYNKLDQPVLTQDANQRAKSPKEWLFTKYDALGRVAYTGIIKNDQNRLTIQDSADNNTSYTQYETKQSNSSTIAATSVYYTNNTIPGYIDKILTVNYYDNYEVGNLVTFNPANGSGTWEGMTATAEVKGLPTVSQVRVLGTDQWITTATYYDNKGRAWETHIKNDYLGTEDWILNKLDFVGKVLKTRTTHTKDNNAAIVTIDTFIYDHMGRLLDQKQTINNQAEERIISNTYDALGQLESKEIGGGLQDVDYTYNVRGWLKEINEGTTDNGDLFGFTINYNTTTENLGAIALYNGNISETSWKTANDNTKRAYGYQYDALNRILAGTSSDGRYNLSNVSYDKNGNIETLQRTGAIVTNPDRSRSGDFGMMDHLAYEYDAGNRLLKVTDEVTMPFGFTKNATVAGDEYQYDVNGNMTVDHNKGISSISYNHLNLPNTVAISNSEGTGNITYIYDATGVKQKKVVSGGSSLATEYAGNHVYENGQLKFFNHAEGYIEPNGEGEFDYVYQYKDHLGNIRLSFSDKDKDGKIDVLRNNADADGDNDYAHEILQEKNYYPFGLQHKGYNDLIVSEHNYGFTGKEEQDELGLGWIDITARNYNPEIGRWMNIDPLADQFPSLSPYNYALNNPLNFVDFDGKAPDPVLLKVVQNAIQNFAVTYAINKINAAHQKVFGKTSLDRPVISSIPKGEKKYIFEEGYLNALLGTNEVNFDGKVALNGRNFDIIGSFHKKSNNSYHEINSVDVLTGKDGSRYTSYASGFDGGFVVELTGGTTTIMRLYLPDAETHKIFENLLNKSGEDYLNNLIQENPELAKLFGLANLKDEVDNLYNSFGRDNPYDENSEQGKRYLRIRNTYRDRRNTYRNEEHFFEELRKKINLDIK